MTSLTDKMFTDEGAARAHFEAIRWPTGVVSCPHCGVEGENTRVKGKSHRPGMFMCNACREPFTVTVGTVMEKSHIPLNKWALGFHLMASSKKGISAHQLHRTLGITYKSAWFMAHRIREAMAPISGEPPLGGEGKVVEADETFLTNSPKTRKRPGYQHKVAVLSLVERGGRLRSFKLGGPPTAYEIKGKISDHVDTKSHLHTDGAQYYKAPGMKHSSVDHSKREYVREDIHTNTVEGVFSVFKRGMVGTYQHCGEQHLQRYLNEFDFRHSNRIKLGVDDTERTRRAIKGAEGKRLTYHVVSG